MCVLPVFKIFMIVKDLCVLPVFKIFIIVKDLPVLPVYETAQNVYKTYMFCLAVGCVQSLSELRVRKTFARLVCIVSYLL